MDRAEAGRCRQVVRKVVDYGSRFARGSCTQASAEAPLHEPNWELLVQRSYRNTSLVSYRKKVDGSTGLWLLVEFAVGIVDTTSGRTTRWRIFERTSRMSDAGPTH